MADTFDETEYSNLVVGVLPPGLESLENMIHGYLRFRVGRLFWSTGDSKIYTPANSIIKVKFWGERGNGQLLRPSTGGIELRTFSYDICYEIRCSVIHFYKYLQDLAKLRLHVLDARNNKPVGVVTVNFLSYLKPKISEGESAPFDDIRGNFAILKLQKVTGAGDQGEKIGDLELDIHAVFLKKPKLTQGEFKPAVSSPIKGLTDQGPKSNELADNRVPISLSRPGDNRDYKPNSFSEPATQQPNTNQNLTGTASFSDTRANQQQQENLGLGKLIDTKQIEDLLLRGKELEKRMLNSEREKVETLPKTNPAAIFSFANPSRSSKNPLFEDYPNIDFGGVGAVDVEFERVKLLIDEATLIDPDYKDIRNASAEKVKQKALDLEKTNDVVFTDLDGLKLNILEFECENMNLKTRLKNEKVALEVSLPISGKDGGDMFDTSRFFAKKNTGDVWFFNNEIAQTLNIQEGEFKALINSSVKFKLQLSSVNPRTNDTIITTLAEGDFSLERLVLAPGYLGSFVVPLKTKIPLNAGKEAGKKDTKKTGKATKAAPTNIIEAETSAGNLTINCQLTSSKADEKRAIRQIEFKEEVPREPTQQSFLPLQMMLYVERIPKVIERRQPDIKPRNIYLSYKIYGTSETIKSDVYWKSDAPYIDHEMLFPLSIESIMKMDTVPFVIEVWDKVEGGKDQLLGLVKMNLTKAKQALFDSAKNEVSITFLSTNTYPLMLYDEALPINDIKASSEIGSIQLVLAIGTPAQLNKFESRLKDKRKQFADVSSRRPNEPSPILVPDQLKESTVSDQSAFEGLKKSTVSEESKLDKSHKKSRKALKELEAIDDAAISGFEALVLIYEQLRSRNALYDVRFQRFLNQSETIYSTEDVAAFFLDSKYNLKPIHIKKLIQTLDFQKSGFIKKEHLIESLKAYIRVEESIRERVTNKLQHFIASIKQKGIKISSLEQLFKSKSKGGSILTYQGLQEILHQHGLQISDDILEYLFHLLDHEQTGSVFIPDLVSIINTIEKTKNLRDLNVRPWVFAESVTNTVQGELQNKKTVTKNNVDRAIEACASRQNELGIDSAIQLFIMLGIDLSFFEILCVFENLKRAYQVLNANGLVLPIKVIRSWFKEFEGHEISKTIRFLAKQPIQIEDLAESGLSEDMGHLAQALNLPKPDEPKKPVEKRPKEPKTINYQDKTAKVEESSDAKLIQELKAELERSRQEALKNRKKQEDLIASLVQQINEKKGSGTSQNIAQTESAKPTEPGKSTEQAKSIVPDYKPQKSLTALETRKLFNKKLYKHSIKINVHEIANLNLSNLPNEAQLVLQYKLPNTHEPVESNTLNFQPHERSYHIKMTSIHSWVLPIGEKLSDLFVGANNGFLIELLRVEDANNKELIAYTVLPIEEIQGMENKILDSPKEAAKFEEINSVCLLYRNVSSQSAAEESHLVVGKLHLTLRYEREHPLNDEYISEDLSNKGFNEELRNKHKLLETEATVQRLLPRNSNLYISFESLQNLQKGIENLKQEESEIAAVLKEEADGAKVRIVLDIFQQHENLSKQHKPVALVMDYKELSRSKINIDHKLSYALEVDQELLDYIQAKAAYVKVQLEFPNKSAEYLIGETKIPLLPLIADQNGISAEFALRNQAGQYSGSIELSISFNKEPTVQRKARDSERSAFKDNNYYKLFISFTEIINFLKIDDLDATDGILFLNINYGKETLRSLFYNVSKRMHLLEMEDNYFFIEIDVNSGFLERGLEIQLVEKTKPKYVDEVIGVAKIDLSKLFEERLREQNYCTESFYVSFCDPQTSNILRARLGTKLTLFKCAQKDKLDRIANNLKTVIQAEKAAEIPKLLSKKADKTGTIRLQDAQSTLRATNKLRIYEIEELTTFFAQKSESILVDVFVRGNCNEEELGAKLQENQMRNLFHEFEHYDTELDGFVELSDAKTIQRAVHEEVQITDEELERFVVAKNPDLSYIDLKKKVGKFDYLLFLRKLCDRTISHLKIDFSRIPRDSIRMNQYFTTKMSPLATRTRSRSPLLLQSSSSNLINLNITVVSGTNFRVLNGGIPPTSIVRCEIPHEKKILFETQPAYRSDSPDFSRTSKTLSLSSDELLNNLPYIEINVYHRAYNENYLQEMQRYELIGSATITLARYMRPDGLVNIDETFLLQPKKAFLIQTQSVAKIRVKITSQVASNALNSQGSFGTYENQELRNYRAANGLRELPGYEPNGALRSETIENFRKTMNEVESSPIFQKARGRLPADEGERIVEIREVNRELMNLGNTITAWSHSGFKTRPDFMETNPFLKNLNQNFSDQKASKDEINQSQLGEENKDPLAGTSRWPSGHREGDEESKGIPNRENPPTKPKSVHSPSSKDATDKTSSDQTGGSKPPLKDSSSTSSIRKLEQKYAGFKDRNELTRIEKIMRTDYSAEKKPYLDSSDEDESDL